MHGIRRLRRIACLLAALCRCAAPAVAAPAVEAPPLTGETCYPAGSDSQSAAFVFSYAYPQFAADNQADTQINAWYAALAADAAGAGDAEAASLGALPEVGTPAWYTRLDYRITQNSDDYLSVLMLASRFLGNTEAESWTANVFARSGVYQGQPVSLSQAMGLEQADGAAQQANVAAELAYGLIWQIIEGERAMQTRAYYPDATEADLRRTLNPESDFYLDADGNIVFFIQAGELASEVEGLLTFPFSKAELLSAAQ